MLRRIRYLYFGPQEVLLYQQNVLSFPPSLAFGALHEVFSLFFLFRQQWGANTARIPPATTAAAENRNLKLQQFSLIPPKVQGTVVYVYLNSFPL